MPVGIHRLRSESGPQLFDALMMVRIHRKRRESEDVFQSSGECHVVHRFRKFPGRLLDMSFHVLRQRPAGADIHQLQSAAYAENRHGFFLGDRQHGFFLRVTGSVDVDTAVHIISVQRRVDVVSADKQQSIDAIHDLRNLFHKPKRRHRPRDTAGIPNACGVIVAQQINESEFRIMFPLDGNGDDGSRKIRHGDTIAEKIFVDKQRKN